MALNSLIVHILPWWHNGKWMAWPDFKQFYNKGQVRDQHHPTLKRVKGWNRGGISQHEGSRVAKGSMAVVGRYTG